MRFLDLLRPKWKHSDPKVRKEAVAGLYNKHLLAVIAEGDKDLSVREAAQRKLDAIYRELDNIRQDDDDMRIVRNTYTLPGRTIRLKVGKEGASFELVPGTAEDVVILPSGASLEVVREIDDPQVLAVTAKQHWDHGVRIAAVRRITDKALLEEIAASVPENSEVYKIVHRSLTKLRDRRAKEEQASDSEQVPTDTLMAQLNDSSAEKKMEAITSLAARNEKAAIPALIKMLEDTDVSVRLRATEALAWITGEDFGEDKQAWVSWRSKHA